MNILLLKIKINRIKCNKYHLIRNFKNNNNNKFNLFNLILKIQMKENIQIFL